jgi:glycosyltransferase involved in cell wall biosynthesis
MKKKVLIIRSNGISYDSRTQKTAQWLSQDYDVELLGWNREGLEEATEKEFGTIYRVGPKAGFGGGFKNILKLLLWQFSILGFLVKNRKKYDILHCADLDTVLFPFLLRRFSKYYIVYDIYDYFTACRVFPKPIEYAVSQLENFVIRHVNGLILVDENRIVQIQTKLPNNTEIIYNTPIMMGNIDDSQIVTSLTISYVGVLDNIRFLRQLIDVISYQLDWTLHIGGYGPIEEYVKTAASKHSNIQFYGRMSPEEAMSINAKSSVLLAIYDPSIPNHRFSSPNKFFESLYLGKILIVADNTSVDKKVKDFQAGYSFDYNNTNAFKDILDAIKQLDDKDIKAISDNNRKKYTEYYSPDKMKQKLLSLYSALK